MLNLLTSPWPWYIAGPLIGLTVPLMYILANKPFGISSSLKHICAMCAPIKPEFFRYQWKDYIWNLVFALGILLGGFLASFTFNQNYFIQLNPATVDYLNTFGIQQNTGLLPETIFSFSSIFESKGLIMLVLGGFLVGFGTRWADGCTSGHSISGLSNLQWPSLLATICFMVGGIFSTWVLLPFILNL